MFAVIYGLVKPNGILNSNWFLLNLLVQAVINLAHLLIVLHAADMPVYQVTVPYLPFYRKKKNKLIFILNVFKIRAFREQVISNTNNSRLNRDFDEQLEVEF